MDGSPTNNGGCSGGGGDGGCAGGGGVVVVVVMVLVMAGDFSELNPQRHVSHNSYLRNNLGRYDMHLYDSYMPTLESPAGTRFSGDLCCCYCTEHNRGSRIAALYSRILAGLSQLNLQLANEESYNSNLPRTLHRHETQYVHTPSAGPTETGLSVVNFLGNCIRYSIPFLVTAYQYNTA